MVSTALRRSALASLLALGLAACWIDRAPAGEAAEPGQSAQAAAQAPDSAAAETPAHDDIEPGPPPVDAVPALPDSGRFIVYQDGDSIGVEQFAYVVAEDSLIVSVRTDLVMPASKDTLVKHAVVVLGLTDFDLLDYRSRLSWSGMTTIRGIVLEDTAMTLFTQYGDLGDAVKVVRPPGRLFVMDPFLYTLFDVIARDLHGRRFEQRPVRLLVLTSDSTSTAIATDHGRETHVWGGKPVETRRIEIAEGPLRFEMWMSPNGQMLRLEEQAFGLGVERVAPPIEHAVAPAGQPAPAAQSKPAPAERKPAPVKPKAPKPGR